MKLYEIAEKYRQIDALLDENGGDVTDGIAAALDSLDGELGEKVDAIGALIRESMATSEAFRAEEARLGTHARVAFRKAQRLKAYLLNHLDSIGVGKAKGVSFSARVGLANTPTIRWPDELGAIPDGFTRTRIELDGGKALEANRKGALPEGFVVERSKFLDLR